MGKSKLPPGSRIQKLPTRIYEEEGDDLPGLPPGSKVEQLPTRIYEAESETDANRRSMDAAVEQGDLAEYEKLEKRNKMLGAVERGDLAEYERLGNPYEIEFGKGEISDRPAPKASALDPMQEMGSKRFNKLQDVHTDRRRALLERARQIKLQRDKNGMLEEAPPSFFSGVVDYLRD